ncbi:MAG TPA: MAPEG family protein, partial [Burkholderiales bacterium]|nr:MAPEG family protein [Burkholderiales bacterium]
IAHMLITVVALFSHSGLMVTVGNRANLPELPGWGGRSVRANDNMAQNLVLFAAVVLAVVVTGTTNATTLLGAQLFFWARVAYAVCYIGGLPWLRTGSWLVSIAGVLLIVSQLK